MQRKFEARAPDALAALKPDEISFIEGLQPYHAFAPTRDSQAVQHHPLFVLEDLWNRDKHRLPNLACRGGRRSGAGPVGGQDGYGPDGEVCGRGGGGGGPGGGRHARGAGEGRSGEGPVGRGRRPAEQRAISSGRWPSTRTRCGKRSRWRSIGQGLAQDQTVWCRERT